MNLLSRKLVLEARVRVADGAGGYDRGWVALGTHWGEVRQGSARLERGEEVSRARASYRIKLRAVSQTSPAYPQAGQRFREGVRIYEIRSVSMDTDARFLTCVVDEEVAS
ncbi:unnamed protein product [Ectocarpus sp. 12 AP-2014]